MNTHKETYGLKSAYHDKFTSCNKNIIFSLSQKLWGFLRIQLNLTNSSHNCRDRINSSSLTTRIPAWRTDARSGAGRSVTRPAPPSTHRAVHSASRSDKSTKSSPRINSRTFTAVLNNSTLRFCTAISLHAEQFTEPN